MADDRGVSTMRLYGSAIALVSGTYSVWAASGSSTASALLMLLLGVVVIVHGAVLVTGFARRLGDASGPLMIGYSVLMLATQGWMATMGDGMMGDGMMDGGAMGGGMARTGLSWDPGMVALALLMLASGVIMTSRRDTM